MIQKNFEIDSDSNALKPVRDDIAFFLKESGRSKSDLETMLVAICEGITNAIRHSYHNEGGHKIKIDLIDEAEKTVIKIRDYGTKIDLSKVPVPKLPPDRSGGLGIHFMKTMMDDVEYRTDHEVGNELILTKFKKGRHRRPGLKD